MWYQTVNPNSIEAVASVLPGYHFHCPDTATVDQHIAQLVRYMEPGSNLTIPRKEAARQDIDRLLERRLYLMLTSEPTDGRHPDQAD